MKFYQRRSVALIVLVLAIVGSSIYGISKRPASLPQVEYYQWIADEAGLLSTDTEAALEKYNSAWNDKYYAVVAVAAVDNVRGWKAENFVYDLGQEWGLGANDMLLLLVEDGDYFVGLGDNLLYMTDTQESKLKAALDEKYYAGDFDGAALSFFRQADVFYAQIMQQSGMNQSDYQWAGSGTSGVGSSVFGVILVVAMLFLVWAALDRLRYNRYRRRVIITPGISYYPIFWGRNLYRPAPPRQPVRPTRPPQGGYRPTGGPTVRQTRPTGRPASRPSGGSSRSGRGSFGNGGFSGGSRGRRR